MTQDSPSQEKGAQAEPNQPVGQPSAGRGLDRACNGDHLLECLCAGGAWLEAHVADVNALNVFPVPDGDTGTNMSLTMRAALDEANSHSYASVSELARIVAHGALMGARGNSGVILSQILRGFARALDGKQTMTALDLAQGLREGAATAYKGVMKPVEGTILTVVRESADAAMRVAAAGGDLQQVLESAVTEAQASLARTPHLLPVLADAGVVDAGGQGFTIILEGILHDMRGEPIARGPAVQVVPEHAHAPEGKYNYDTQFIIQGTGLDVDAIRDYIATCGDSVLVVGDAETIKVHVHCDTPGRVLDYGIGQGRVSGVIIENMQLQYEQFKGSGPKVETSAASRPPAALISCGAQTGEIGIVAVVVGQGLQRVFESLGVSAIVSGGQTMNPSTQDLLNAINSVPCDKVIVLPNNSNILLAAQQARELATKQVRVVATKTIPQGIAALLAYNYQADLDTNAEIMLDASRKVKTAEVTKAVRSVQVNGLAIAEGQIIGLVNGDLTTVGEEIPTVVGELLALVRADELEIVTIYYGEDVLPEEAAQVAAYVKREYPNLEVEVLDGGQALYYYVISAE